MNHKTNFFTAGTLALLAFSGLAACGGGTQGTSSPGSYAAHGVSFHYPRGWHRGRPGVSFGVSSRMWAVAVGTPGNSVDVTANRLGHSLVVTRQNLQVLTAPLGDTVRGQYRHLHGELIAGPHAITVGGMPGLQFAGTAKLHGTAQKLTLVSAFNGSTEYTITCLSTPAKARAVRQACSQVLRTFKVSKLFMAGAALVYRKHGVSFDYPPGWAAAPPTGPSAGCRGCDLWATAVAPDAFNGVNVNADRQSVLVTRKNLPAAVPVVTRGQRRLLRHFGGRLVAGPHPLTVGGMPGLAYLGTAKLYGSAVHVTVVMVFHGKTSYTITCTSTRAKARAVHRACAEVLRTFKVTPPSKRV
jgi:hypothetical protein